MLVLNGNLTVKNARKNSAKYLQRKICKIKQMIWKNEINKNKHFSNSVDIFKSTKNILEKLKTKEDSSNPTTSRFKQNS